MRADEALAATTADQTLQAAIAEHRADLRPALATNPALYPELLKWLADLPDPAVAAAIATVRASQATQLAPQPAGQANGPANGGQANSPTQ